MDVSRPDDGNADDEDEDGASARDPERGRPPLGEGMAGRAPWEALRRLGRPEDDSRRECEPRPSPPPGRSGRCRSGRPAKAPPWASAESLGAPVTAPVAAVASVAAAAAAAAAAATTAAWAAAEAWAACVAAAASAAKVAGS